MKQMAYKRVLGSAVIAASFMAAVTNAQAQMSIAAVNIPSHSTNKWAGKAHEKVKTVRFALRNESSLPLKVKIEGEELTVLPKRAIDLRLKVGEQILAMDQAPDRKEGDVLATVTEYLNGNAIAVR